MAEQVDFALPDPALPLQLVHSYNPFDKSELGFGADWGHPSASLLYLGRARATRVMLWPSSTRDRGGWRSSRAGYGG